MPRVGPVCPDSTGGEEFRPRRFPTDRETPSPIRLPIRLSAVFCVYVFSRFQSYQVQPSMSLRARMSDLTYEPVQPLRGSVCMKQSRPSGPESDAVSFPGWRLHELAD